jgi:hypothetical protein
MPGERSRTIVVIAALALIVFAIADVVLYFRLKSRMETLERQAGLLAEMEIIDSEVSQVRERSTRAVLSEGRTLDPAEVTQLAKARGLGESIKATAPSAVELGGGLREQLLDIEFEAVTREDLGLFIKSVEELDPGILTKGLRIRPASGQTEYVNADVQFSGYAKASPNN